MSASASKLTADLPRAAMRTGRLVFTSQVRASRGEQVVHNIIGSCLTVVDLQLDHPPPAQTNNLARPPLRVRCRGISV